MNPNSDHFRDEFFGFCCLSWDGGGEWIELSIRFDTKVKWCGRNSCEFSSKIFGHGNFHGGICVRSMPIGSTRSLKNMMVFRVFAFLFLLKNPVFYTEFKSKTIWKMDKFCIAIYPCIFGTRELSSIYVK